MGVIRKILSPKTGRVCWQIDYLDPDDKRINKNFKKQKDAKAHPAKNSKGRSMKRADADYLQYIVECAQYRHAQSGNPKPQMGSDQRRLNLFGQDQGQKKMTGADE